MDWKDIEGGVTISKERGFSEEYSGRSSRLALENRVLDLKEDEVDLVDFIF